MAQCEYCKKDMLIVDDCSWNRSVKYTDSTVLPSIPFGGGTWGERYPRKDNEHCHDCGVAVGHYHHPGCDMEECALCHGQLISCDCGVAEVELNENSQYDFSFMSNMELILMVKQLKEANFPEDHNFITAILIELGNRQGTAH